MWIHPLVFPVLTRTRPNRFYTVSHSLFVDLFFLKIQIVQKNVQFNQLKSSFDEFTFHQKNSKERFSKEKMVNHLNSRRQDFNAGRP